MYTNGKAEQTLGVRLTRMKYELVGIPDETALDRPQKLDGVERVLQSPLKRLNSLLGLLMKQTPESVEEYASNLESKFSGLVGTNYVVERSIDLKHHMNELEYIKEYPTLAEISLNYLLGELKMPIDSEWSDDMQVVQRDYLRAFLSSRYHNVDVLTETVGREQAIKIYKEHFEKVTEQWVEKAEERYKNLDEFVKDTKTEDPENPGWMRLVGEAENGKVVFRKDTCLWADAMQEYPDSELKFLVCCYGDYTSIKSGNRNFALTMEHSIAGGHPYCDCVVYDTRINNEFEHPPDEFFANLKPST